jgi:hypothetical protein
MVSGWLADGGIVFCEDADRGKFKVQNAKVKMLNGSSGSVSRRRFLHFPFCTLHFAFARLCIAYV